MMLETVRGSTSSAKHPPRSSSAGGDVPSGYQERNALDLLEKTVIDGCQSEGRAVNVEVLGRALKWSSAQIKSAKIDTVDDQFSAPLLIARKLIKFHTNPETLLDTVTASILYPAARTSDGSGIDPHRLEDIEIRFGRNVRGIVEDTLKLRAHKVLSLVTGAKQSAEEHEKLSVLKALWEVDHPSAIQIRAIQSVINLENIIERRSSFSDVDIQNVVAGAKVLSSLAYIADSSFRSGPSTTGDSLLRREILNLCDMVENYKDHIETSTHIYKSFNEDVGAEIIKSVVTLIETEFGWEHNTHFRVGFRPKAAHSAREKAKRKEQHFSELGDLGGLIFVLYPNIIGWNVDESTDSLSEKDKTRQTNKLMKQLGQKILQVHGIVSKEHGRGNKHKTHTRFNEETRQVEKYSPIQERFAELAVTESRDSDKGRLEDPRRAAWEKRTYPKFLDARFDDYVTYPKPNGYSGLHDTLLFYIPGREKPVEIEAQFVDEIRYKSNTFGLGVGHLYYKINLGAHAKEVHDWIECAKAKIAGVDSKIRRRQYMLGPHNEIFEVSRNPSLAALCITARENTASAFMPAQPAHRGATSQSALLALG